MNCKKIIPLLLIFIAAVSTLSMACATDPRNGTDQAITPDEQTQPTIHYDTDCNTTADTNGNNHTVSHENVLPGPIQTNKTIQYENNTPKHQFIAYNQPITQQQPFYNIVDETTLEQALNTGGHYKITQDITIHYNYNTAGTQTPTYIDGQNHKITSDCDKETSKYTITGETEWNNTNFEKVYIVCEADATFNGCTWKNQEGMSFEHASALSADGCLLVLYKCHFINITNRAGDHGAVYVKNGWTRITGCYFQDCGNKQKWGAHNEGGAIFVTNTESRIVGCTFNSCYCLGDGGAVCTENGNNLIKNCEFISCYNLEKIWFLSTSNKGAGVYCMGTTTIQDSRFHDCKADGMRYEKWGGNIDKDNDINVNVINCVSD